MKGSVTADEFVKAMAEKLKGDEELLKEVIKEYSAINEGHNLGDDILGDFSGKTQTELLLKLSEETHEFAGHKYMKIGDKYYYTTIFGLSSAATKESFENAKKSSEIEDNL